MAGQSLRSHFRFPWEELYVDAVLETDSVRLQQLSKEAEETIRGRLRVLSERHDQEAELRAVENARRGLEILKWAQVNRSSDTMERGSTIS